MLCTMRKPGKPLVQAKPDNRFALGGGAVTRDIGTTELRLGHSLLGSECMAFIVCQQAQSATGPSPSKMQMRALKIAALPPCIDGLINVEALDGMRRCRFVCALTIYSQLRPIENGATGCEIVCPGRQDDAGRHTQGSALSQFSGPQP